MPLLLPVIETLWLQTGSCLRLLYPDYIRALKHDWRGQIIRALQAGDGDAARRAIESDIGPALAYIADLAGEDGIIQPHSARSGPRSEEHTSELQSLMRSSYAVFCLKKKT